MSAPEENTKGICSSKTEKEQSASEPTSQTVKRPGRPLRSCRKSKRQVSSSVKGREKTEDNLPSKTKSEISRSSTPSDDEGNVDPSMGWNDAMVRYEQLLSSNSDQEPANMQALEEQTMPNLTESVSDQLNNPELDAQPLKKFSSVKMASVWDAILSLDIFQEVPQRPHFSSFQQIDDAHREGVAISYMVNFANLAYSLPKLSLDDSNDLLARRLGDLEDFEQHGFKVDILRDRLENLIGRKKMLEDVSQETALIEAEITQKAKECYELTCALDDISKNLKELEDRKSEVMRTKEVCENMKLQLEEKLQMLLQKSNDIRNSFQSEN